MGKCRFRSMTMPMHYVGIRLDSYLLDDFSISLILGSRIFAIQEESHEHEDRTEEAEPVVSRERESWSSCSLYLHQSWYIDTLSLTWYSSHRWSYSLWGRTDIVDEEERREEHDGSESRDHPSPDALTENPWIEESAYESDGREEVECVLELCRESPVHSRDIVSEVDDCREYECKNHTSDTDVLICWLLCELGESVDHR